MLDRAITIRRLEFVRTSSQSMRSLSSHTLMIWIGGAAALREKYFFWNPVKHLCFSLLAYMHIGNFRLDFAAAIFAMIPSAVATIHPNHFFLVLFPFDDYCLDDYLNLHLLLEQQRHLHSCQ